MFWLDRRIINLYNNFSTLIGWVLNGILSPPLIDEFFNYIMFNLNKFTTKSQEALRQAQEIAYDHQNQQVDALHLLAALLVQEESLVLSILKKIEVDI